MPIFEVLKNQESHTAICAHFMNAHFDEGDIIFNDPILINENETYGSLTVKLSNRVGQVALNMANMLQFTSAYMLLFPVGGFFEDNNISVIQFLKQIF